MIKRIALSFIAGFVALPALALDVSEYDLDQYI